MPELPEVITIRQDLTKEIKGKKIKNIKTFNDYNLNPSPHHFKNHVLGHSVEEISNIAKLLVIKLSSGKYIATHLNMSGLLLFNNSDPYVKISLEFEDGSVLNYSTVRMFGYFEVWDETKLQEYKKRYGKTAIESDITDQEFIDQITKTKTYIKNALLNQKLVSGIGNIYANDALYLSKIHPKKKTNEITNKKLIELFNNVKLLLKEGVKNRGSSIDRYRDLYGKKGSQQNYFRVYGKTDTQCIQCKKDVIKFEKLQGRGTFFCETCQNLTGQQKLF